MMTLMLAQTTAQAGGDGTYLLWGLLLALAAVGLFVLELFVPTGGVLGLLVAAAVIASVVCFFRYDRTMGFVAIGGYCLLGPIAIVYAIRWWTNSWIGRRMILGGNDPSLNMPEEEAAHLSEEARAARLAALDGLVGAQGRAETTLRPVGFVSIQGRRIDAMAESGYIEAGRLVEVIEICDNQVKVRTVA